VVNDELGALSPTSQRHPIASSGVVVLLRSKLEAGMLAEHPGHRLNPGQPVSDGGNPAKVFEDVLLADESHGKNPACRERDGHPEDLFQQINALGVVPERTVPEVSQVGFTGVEKLV